MSNKSKNQSPNKALEVKTSKLTAALRGIEYYLSNNGSDTKVVRDIALSALIPRANGDKKIQHVTKDEVYKFPFFIDNIFGITEIEEENPFWSFTMMIKDGGEHKLLFSSQEDAEEIYTEVLKEQEAYYTKHYSIQPSQIKN